VLCPFANHFVGSDKKVCAFLHHPVLDHNILCCTEGEKMQNQDMQPIDLVKHQTTLLPGLEHSIQHLLGEMCQIRKTLKLPALILVEDPEEMNRLYRERKDLRDKAVSEAWLNKKRKEAADAARERIRQKEISEAEKNKLQEFRRKLKTGTLIEPPDRAGEDWREGSTIKPAPSVKRGRA
jgi:hypothetical protein